MAGDPPRADKWYIFEESGTIRDPRKLNFNLFIKRVGRSPLRLDGPVKI